MVEEDIQVSYSRNVADIVDKWNSLTQDCINCTTINAFKRHIQKLQEPETK